MHDDVPDPMEPETEGAEPAEPVNKGPKPTEPVSEGAKPMVPEAEASAEEAPVLPPDEIRAVLEALIFASPQPLTPRDIGKVLGGVPKEAWQAALQEIRADYARDSRGLQLVEIAGGYQITSGVIKTLLEKRLIRITGRKEVVGRPMLYGTTKEFLLHFGLKDLGELPKIEEFAEVLGEEVDVAGLKKAIEAPRPVEVPLSDAELGGGADPAQGELPLDVPSGPGEDEPD